jgi:hypothetical protein
MEIGSGIVFGPGISLVIPASGYFTATGGTMITSGVYKIHSFASSGTFTVTNGGQCDILIVGGGGGASSNGGNNTAGAGGGGGATLRQVYTLGAGTYTVVVGAGGTAQMGDLFAGRPGNSGTASTFGALFTEGGGGFGKYGAGGASSAGGGGAGAAGSGSNGGDGIEAAIFNGWGYPAGWFGGGGDGMSGTSPGGKGGGAAYNTYSRQDGRLNTGGGGAPAGFNVGIGGYGGSGIVLIRYQYKA